MALSEWLKIIDAIGGTIAWLMLEWFLLRCAFGWWDG